MSIATGLAPSARNVARCVSLGCRRIFRPFRSAMVLIGRTLLVTWRGPSSMKPSEMKPLSAIFWSISVADRAVHHLVGDLAIREQERQAHRLELGHRARQERHADPRHHDRAGAHLRDVLLRAAELHVGNTSTITLPPVAASTSFLNCSIATDEECSTREIAGDADLLLRRRAAGDEHARSTAPACRANMSSSIVRSRP